MAELKTKRNDASVSAFIARITDEERRSDCLALVKLMKQVTKTTPRMWGASIVGFGSYHYKYASGHEGDCPLTGFSPRKQALTLYVMSGFDRVAGLLAKLGKHKTGKCCLYVKRLSDIDHAVLRDLIARSVTEVKRKEKA